MMHVVIMMAFINEVINISMLFKSIWLGIINHDNDFHCWNHQHHAGFEVLRPSKSYQIPLWWWKEGFSIIIMVGAEAHVGSHDNDGFHYHHDVVQSHVVRYQSSLIINGNEDFHCWNHQQIRSPRLRLRLLVESPLGSKSYVLRGAARWWWTNGLNMILTTTSIVEINNIMLGSKLYVLRRATRFYGGDARKGFTPSLWSGKKPTLDLVIMMALITITMWFIISHHSSSTMMGTFIVDIINRLESS